MSVDLFQKINEIIDRSSTIVIAGHENPDGDCMGSSLAVASILRRMGKKVTLFKEDLYPFNYMFLEGADDTVSLISEEDPDMFLILDCGSPERVGERLFKRMLSSKSSRVLFDHHVKQEGFCSFYDEVYIDESACATAAIVYRWATGRSLDLTKAESESIYAGIVSDTGGLKYGSTNKESFIILSELLEKVNPWEIATNIYENIPANQIKMLGEVLSDLRVLADGKAAVIRVTLEQFKKYDLHPDNVDSFVNYARSIKGVQIALRFREKGENIWKVSMRSRGDIDSVAIASRFGGGGHRNASGFVFKGTFAQGLKEVEEIVKSVSK